MDVKVGWRSDVGRRREKNEDAVLVEPPLLMVADGMGGYPGGDVASALAVAVFRDARPRLLSDPDPGRVLAETVEEAHVRIVAEGAKDPERARMGTTVTAALLGDGSAFVVHAGDTRCYRFRDGVLERMTDDDSLVGELVRGEILSEEEAERHPQRHLVTKALGTGQTEPVHPAVLEVAVVPGDRLVLCTDGLHSMLMRDDITGILAASDDPQAAADALVDEANQRDSLDNVTVVVANLS